MKRFILTLLLTSVLTAGANQLTPLEALSRINNLKGDEIHTRSMENVVPLLKFSPVEDNGFVSIYVFDIEDGFMIVSADDCAIPLLGYGPGRLDRVEMVPGLRYWLESYAEEIYSAAGLGNNVTYYTESGATSSEIIAPLVSAKWNQGNPYNLLTPEFNGKRSMAGCVAVAMAQVMYSHQWPDRCEGGNLEYTSSYNENFVKDLSLDFNNVSFDWNILLDSYGGKDVTEESKEEVAKLMMACGYAVKTNYSPAESTAYSSNELIALYNYFNYSPSVQSLYREYYTNSEWENIIYNQLIQGLPVLYGGFSISGGGHRFVCDGYDGNGFFHINWGWGGMSDGYFRLSALDPAFQGIGGSVSGYNYGQDAIINIAKPDKEIKDVSSYMLYCTGDFLTSKIASDFSYDASEVVALGENVEFIRGSGTYIWNTSCRPVDGAFGICLKSENGENVYLFSENEVTLNVNKTIRKQTVRIPESLTEGHYSVSPVFKVEETDDIIPLRCPLTAISTMNLQVENGIATFTVGDYARLEAISAVFKTKVREDSYFSLDVDLENLGNIPFYGTVGAKLLKDGKIIAKTNETMIVELSSGERKTFNLIGKFSSDSGNLEPGSYELGLYDGDNNDIPIEVPVIVDVTNNNNDPTKVIATAFSYNADSADLGVITFTGTIECLEGDFGGQATIWIFSYDDVNRYYSAATSFLFINQGESADFSATANISQPGDYYAYIYINGSYIYKPYVTFNVPDAAGVNEVTTHSDMIVYPIPTNDILYVESEVMLEYVSIYNMAGKEVISSKQSGRKIEMNVGNLSSGIYLVQAHTSSGRTIIKKILKR